MIYNGPVINEQVISNIRPDPLPDDRYGGGGNNGDPNANMNIIELLTMCLSLVNLARQWYQAVNEKPDVVSLILLYLRSMHVYYYTLIINLQLTIIRFKFNEHLLHEVACFYSFFAYYA